MSTSLKAAAACALFLTLAACRGSDGGGDATPAVPPAPGVYTGTLPDGREVNVVLTSDLVVWGAAFRFDTGQATVFRTSYTYDGSQVDAVADQPQGLPALPSGTTLRISASYTADAIQGNVFVTRDGVSETLPITLNRKLSDPAAPMAPAGNVSPLEALAAAPAGVTLVSTNLAFQVDAAGQLANGSASPQTTGTASFLRGNLKARSDCDAFNFNFQVGDPVFAGNSALEGTAFQAVVIPRGASGYVGFGVASDAQQAKRVVFLRKVN